MENTLNNTQNTTEIARWTLRARFKEARLRAGEPPVEASICLGMEGADVELDCRTGKGVLQSFDQARHLGSPAPQAVPASRTAVHYRPSRPLYPRTTSTSFLIISGSVSRITP